MIGAAVEANSGSRGVPARTLANIGLAAALHVLLVLYLTVPSHPWPDEPEATMEIIDIPGLAAIEPSLPAPVPAPDKAPVTGTAKSIETLAQPLPQKEEPKTETAERVGPETLARPQVTPPEPPPRTLEPEAEQPRKPLPVLEPFVAPTVAYDGSKHTKEAPEHAYLSDRTSTAADRGPKNLPRGDPYIDKGHSDLVRTLKVRGEGNLPPMSASPASGSVEKEGLPEAGKGPELGVVKRAPPPVQNKPAAPANQFAPADEAEPAKPPAAVPPPRPALAPQPRPEPGRLVRDDADAADMAAVAVRKNSAAPLDAPALVPEPPAKLAARKPGEPPSKTIRAPEPSRPQPDPDAELAAFSAALDGSSTHAAGNEKGEKPGLRGRAGARGQEGDGTLRPGHEDAVSDVTTINLRSGAAEYDDPRFAKIADPVAVYLRNFFRRVDTKWRAESGSRNRLRIVAGVVRIRLVIRKDGQLLEAAETGRVPQDMPDEMAAMAKIAVQRAADPKSEPFPPELQDREKIDATIGFIY